MAVTFTHDVGYGTKYTMDAFMANGLGFVHGTFNCSGLTYVPGGITATFPFHNFSLVFIENRLVTATNIFYFYDSTNTKITMFTMNPTTTAAGVPQNELASDTALSSLTAVRYIAIGRD